MNVMNSHQQALCGLLSLILPNSITRCIHPSTPPNLIDSDGLSEPRAVHRVSSCDERRAIINILPDDVLLHIFLIDRLEYWHTGGMTYLPGEDYDRVRRLAWTWHRLVHVCRRWRCVVFASPNFLNLGLVCGPRTPLELTGIWPPLPVIITNGFDLSMSDFYDFDAVIVHPNRVREIRLFYLTRLILQRLASATLMQEQFPALTHFLLRFHRGGDPAPALPDEFLGGSVPRLQSLELNFIPFPALPKLLLSATHLVRLNLHGIPHSRYFSPEAIATGLATTANLKYLIIKFDSPLSRPNQESRRSPLQTRSILPALARFEFKGASEYLEDFVARIDTPLLDSIYITFFHQLIFDIPQLAQFMRRTTRFQELTEVYMTFDRDGFYVETLPSTRTYDENSGLGISCNELDWQPSPLAQAFTSFFPSIYTIEHLYIYELAYFSLQWQRDIENTQWLEIFHPFTAVKNLYVSEKLAPSIAPALVGERTTEMFPTLQNIYLEGLQPWDPMPEGIQKFVAARQLSGHPITVSLWERDL